MEVSFHKEEVQVIWFFLENKTFLNDYHCPEDGGAKFSILGVCLCTYVASVVYCGGLKDAAENSKFEIGGGDEYTQELRAKSATMFGIAFPLGLMAVIGVLSTDVIDFPVVTLDHVL